jgi:transcriptional regulator with GAF, ATPase, and Fis domain
MVSQQVILARTFVELADTIVDDYDVIEVLTTLAHRCVEIFGGEAGIMLADRDGRLHTAASSSERMQQVELFEVQHEQGPCPDAFRDRIRVVCPDLVDAADRWPLFAPRALDAGFHAVHAIPMRLRQQSLGAMNLLSERPGPMADDDLSSAQALADVATIAILQHRAAEDARVVVRQLHEALNSRIVIEQAKGFVAQVLATDTDVAFSIIRSYARSHNRRLAEVARDITVRTLAPDDL